MTYQVIAREPLVAVLPSDHPLATRTKIDPRELEGETFIGFTDIAHVLRDVVSDYLQAKGLNLAPSHHIGNFAMGLSLVASTRGVALLPAYVEPLLPWSVVSRPLMGEAPTIDLVVGYREDNTSPVLRTFLSGIDQIISEGPAGVRAKSG